MSRSSKALAIFLGIAFAATLVLKAASVYTDYLWFGEMAQTRVFTTVWAARLGVGLVLAAIFFGWLYLNIRVARRSSPEGITFVGRRLLPEAERASIEQHADRALLIFAAIGSLLVLIFGSSYWLQWLWYRNAQQFGDKDPIFHKEIGFYVFQLPLIEQLWRSAFYFVAIALVAVVLIYLYEECIRISGPLVQSTAKARYHCLGLLALALLLKTYSYRLAMYKTLWASVETVPGGASYIHVHYLIPAYWLLMVASIVGAGLCLYGARIGNLRIPAYAIAGIILISVLGTMAFPSIMRKLRVVPAELALEEKYIARHIEATSKAFGVDREHVKLHRRFEVKTGDQDLTREHINRNWETIDNIRIWDDLPLEVIYTMQQALRRYYEFANVDVDRYAVDGRLRQVAIAARQLNLVEDKQEGITWSWLARHLQYTHGYGLCVSPINEVDSEGRPVYWLKEFPVLGKRELAVERGPDRADTDYAGIYFPERMMRQMVTYAEQPPPAQPRGGPGGGPEQAVPQFTEREPAASDVKPGVRQQVPRRQAPDVTHDYVIVGAGTDAVFAARFMDLPILVRSFGRDAKILFNRFVPDRLYELTRGTLLADPDPYLVISEGRLYWIVDMYTWASRYPYSGSVPIVRGATINYFRNSVKAVVDCYEGTTRLYVWDEQDPVLKAYRQAFPKLFTPKEQMPAGLLKHVRYPMGLFSLQAALYGRYHMAEPRTFFNSEDWWAAPKELYEESRERDLAPYYVLMRLPGEGKLEFVLMQPFAVRGRERRNMAAWMCARCDPEHYGELVVYAFPKDRLPDGPMMIESRISQDAEISKLITLWGQQQSVVKRGHVIVLPIEDSLLYVEPLYVESQRNPVPELRLVSVAYGQNRLAFADTLDGALDKLFGAGAAPPAVVAPEPEPQAPEVAVGAPSELGDLIEKALAALTAADQARQSGDLATYQQKNSEAKGYVEQAKALVEEP